jgi:beta-carotene 3-hydroxylase
MIQISVYTFYFLVVLITFLWMEWVAWFMHKYVMHGFLWILHEDHHRYTGHRFQKNDIFALFFVSISVLLIYIGNGKSLFVLSWIGVGMAAYGFGYFLFHDVLFHQRIKIPYVPRGSYLKRIIRAHATHHQKSSAQQGVAFGFLYASRKYEVAD